MPCRIFNFDGTVKIYLYESDGEGDVGLSHTPRQVPVMGYCDRGNELWGHETQKGQCTYKVTLRPFRQTIVAVEKH